MVNKKLLLILFSLITFTSYSQENDDVYWTMYDADTIEQETTTNITNNYYCDYTSRINRFYRRPFYASYWSYHNPYWYSYHYPFYLGYYWYNPYRYYSWYWSPHYNYAYWYSYRPNYYFSHYYPTYYHPHYRTANNAINKKQIKKSTHKPTKVNSTVYKPKSTVKQQPNYSKYNRPKSVKYNKPKQTQPRPISTSPSIPKYTRPRSTQKPTKITPTKPKVNYSRSPGVRKPR